MKLIDSAVLVTMTHITDHRIPEALRIEGTNYHRLTFKKSGPPHGPSGPWLITRAAITAYDAA